MKKRIIATCTRVLTLVLALGFAGCKKNDKTDWDYIADKGELVIGITYFRPMNYMENGELVGFETEFAKAVCEKLGVTRKVPGDRLGFESHRTQLQDYRLHLERHDRNGRAQESDQFLQRLYEQLPGRRYPQG